MDYFVRTKKCHQDHGCCERSARLESLVILINLLLSHLDAEELIMGKTNVISNILHVGVREYA